MALDIRNNKRKTQFMTCSLYQQILLLKEPCDQGLNCPSPHCICFCALCRRSQRVAELMTLGLYNLEKAETFSFPGQPLLRSLIRRGLPGPSAAPSHCRDLTSYTEAAAGWTWGESGSACASSGGRSETPRGGPPERGFSVLSSPSRPGQVPTVVKKHSAQRSGLRSR